MQRSHKFDFFNNSNHLKDLVVRILWTMVMSFSDAQAMILSVIITTALLFDPPRHAPHLLACAPLPPVSLDVGNEEEESTEFNADAHVNYFQKTFELYGIEYDSWVLCQCADSAAVNPKISRETHCRHISCKNHNLALAKKVMLEEDGELQDLITKVFASGAYVRNSCKVITGLRNKAAAVDPKLTNVSAKSESATRQWLGAAITMK